MTIIEALRVLGLNSNYTESELKKAYRTLAFKYHPDNHMNEPKIEQEKAQEMMKKINAAYEFLLKQKKEYGSFDIDEIDEYRQNILEKIRSYMSTTTSTMPYYSLNKTIKAEVARASVRIIYSDDKRAIDRLYQEFLSRVHGAYENYKRSYFKTYAVYDEDIKETIDYNCAVDEFFSQLENIKKKYGKIEQIKKRIEAETQKYKLYSTYNKNIEKAIEHIVERALYMLHQNNYKNIDEVLATMHERIVNLFKLEDELNAQVKDLEERIKNLQDKNLAYDLNVDKIRYKAFGDSKEFKEQLNSIERKVKRLEELKTNKNTIDDLYRKLLERFTEANTYFYEKGDFFSLERLLELYRYILTRFDMYKKAQITLEELLILKEIDFKDTNSFNNWRMFNGKAPKDMGSKEFYEYLINDEEEKIDKYDYYDKYYKRR